MMITKIFYEIILLTCLAPFCFSMFTISDDSNSFFHFLKYFFPTFCVGFYYFGVLDELKRFTGIHEKPSEEFLNICSGVDKDDDYIDVTAGNKDASKVQQNADPERNCKEDKDKPKEVQDNLNIPHEYKS